jgi:phosphatidylserine/phosphatidylglycerophosphate/cardiolipin synthase-like enzyme
MAKKSSGPKTQKLSVWGVLVILIIIAYMVWRPDAESVPPTITDSAPSQPQQVEKLPAWLTVYFTNPNPPDDLNNGVDQKIVPLIESATESIDVASFDLNLPSVIDALVKAKERGVEVRVVYDGENGSLVLDADKSPTQKDYNGIKIFKAAKIPVVDGGRSNGLMHNKMIIVDGKTLVMGSWNMSYNDTYRNNNNILVITESRLIANYQNKFNEMFVDKLFGTHSETGALVPELTVDGVKVENYFSPRDEVMQKLVSYVQNAQKSVRFIAFTYTHRDLAEAMVERYKAGVDVAGIIENRAATQGALVPLFCAGVPVKVDGNKYTMHHKIIIIDESIVITGSFNFTATADESNDDNLIVIHSPALARLYLEEYDRVNALAQAPDPNDEDFKKAAADKWPTYCK